jgi:hypothetical protein
MCGQQHQETHLVTRNSNGSKVLLPKTSITRQFLLQGLDNSRGKGLRQSRSSSLWVVIIGVCRVKSVKAGPGGLDDFESLCIAGAFSEKYCAKREVLAAW